MGILSIILNLESGCHNQATDLHSTHNPTGNNPDLNPEPATPTGDDPDLKAVDLRSTANTDMLYVNSLKCSL
jgi:hypothetical protein